MLLAISVAVFSYGLLLPFEHRRLKTEYVTGASVFTWIARAVQIRVACIRPVMSIIFVSRQTMNPYSQYLLEISMVDAIFTELLIVWLIN